MRNARSAFFTVYLFNKILLICDVWSHYNTYHIFEFFLDRLAMLIYGLDLNVATLLANLLTKPSVFYYFAKCIQYYCFNNNYYYYYYFVTICYMYFSLHFGGIFYSISFLLMLNCSKSNTLY